MKLRSSLILASTMDQGYLLEKLKEENKELKLKMKRLENEILQLRNKPNERRTPTKTVTPLILSNSFNGLTEVQEEIVDWPSTPLKKSRHGGRTPRIRLVGDSHAKKFFL